MGERCGGTRWAARALAGLALLAVGLGLAWGQGRGVDLLDVRSPAPAVYVPATYPIAFDHARHVALADCATCHEGVEQSDHSGHVLLPAMTVCASCHPQAQDTEDPTACAFCHPGYRPSWPDGPGLMSVRDPLFPLVAPAPAFRPPPNLVFSHAAHADITCAGCHDPATHGGAVLPVEADCLTCHAAESDAPLACSGCHPTREDGRLRTEVPGNALVPTVLLRPRDHDEDWLAGHVLAARSNATSCFTCHSEADCLACHDGTLAVDAIHPPGFLSHHAVEARRNEPSCVGCHTPSTYCVDCHVDAQVSTEETGRPPLGARFHPEGWLDALGGEHALAAQRNLVECASCHSEDDCVQCHSTVNPHGAEFFNRCDSLLSANPQVCARCHRDVGALQLGCP